MMKMYACHIDCSRFIFILHHSSHIPSYHHKRMHSIFTSCKFYSPTLFPSKNEPSSNSHVLQLYKEIKRIFFAQWLETWNAYLFIWLSYGIILVILKLENFLAFLHFPHFPWNSTAFYIQPYNLTEIFI